MYQSIISGDNVLTESSLPCTWVKSPMLENTWDLHWCLQAIFCISQEKILPEQWDLTEWTCAFVTNSILQISEYTILLIHIIPDKTTKETLRKAADRSLTYGVSLFFLFSDPSTSELNITDPPKQHLGHAGGKKKYKNNNNKPHHTDSVSPSLERGFDLCVPWDSTANTIKKKRDDRTWCHLSGALQTLKTQKLYEKPSVTQRQTQHPTVPPHTRTRPQWTPLAGACRCCGVRTGACPILQNYTMTPQPGPAPQTHCGRSCKSSNWGQRPQKKINQICFTKF